MGWARTEKQALAATLRVTDPRAATLCAGWDARRLLAHLVQREQDPRGGLADALARPAPGEEKHLGRLADAAATPQGWTALVERFLAGPPRWSPMAWAADQLNLVEYVVHHEDVRRAGPEPAVPRVLPAGQNAALWRQVPLLGRLRFRRSPVPVTLALPDGTRTVVRQGPEGVTLTGEPVELALHVLGRREPARVQVSGPPVAVQAFQAWVQRP